MKGEGFVSSSKAKLKYVLLGIPTRKEITNV